MQKFDLHTHSTFSDGKFTPEEMVKAAIEKGLDTIGISDHSYTSCDESYCMPKEKYGEYIETVNALKEKYKDKIKVLCGVEQDYYGDIPADIFDYSVGSVHYVKFGDEYFPADHTPDVLKEAAEKYCDGDIYTVIEEYYRTVGLLPEVQKVDIVGHFDVVTKYLEKEAYFDTHHPRYVKAWQAAADKLLTYGIPFEINTGAVSRGYKSTAYPADEIREYILERGGTLVFSSDAHSVDAIAYGFM